MSTAWPLDTPLWDYAWFSKMVRMGDTFPPLLCLVLYFSSTLFSLLSTCYPTSYQMAHTQHLTSLHSPPIAATLNSPYAVPPRCTVQPLLTTLYLISHLSYLACSISIYPHPTTL